MLVKKKWLQKSKLGLIEWPMEGWFLFGFIPLYMRDLQPRYRR